MHFEMAVVVDKTKFAELVHEVAHARSSCPDHLREYFLTYLSLAVIGSGRPCLPKFASNSSSLASRFSVELNS